MNGMTGGVEVLWTLLICNYIKFNNFPGDVELVIFHWLSFPVFFLGCWYWSWGSQFPIPPYVLGPLTYQQQLAVRANLTHRLLALLGTPGLGVIFDMFGFLRCWLGSIWDRLCLYWFFLTRAMLFVFVFPFGKHDSGTQTKYLAVWAY